LQLFFHYSFEYSKLVVKIDSELQKIQQKKQTKKSISFARLSLTFKEL